MAISRDTKDWTWVIERRCAECGFAASELRPTDVAGLLRESAAAWPAVLERADVRQRPNDFTWSPLEYAAHVRDVLRLYRARLALMLETDDPLYENWDQDATAVAGRYNEQDPAVVGAELQFAASVAAAARVHRGDLRTVPVPRRRAPRARRDEAVSRRGACRRMTPCGRMQARRRECRSPR
jgi:hypothetical protein